MQTAATWLVGKFKQYQQDGEKMTWQQVIDTAELALAMEKEQIIEAWDKGDFTVDDGYGDWVQMYRSGEDYYNQTYKP
jgi:hypothetical protein